MHACMHSVNNYTASGCSVYLTLITVTVSSRLSVHSHVLVRSKLIVVSSLRMQTLTHNLQDMQLAIDQQFLK